MAITSASDLKRHYDNVLKGARLIAVMFALLSLLFFGTLTYFSGKQAMLILGIISAIAILVFHRVYYRKSYSRLALFQVDFPVGWRTILQKHSLFYRNLNALKRELFEKRVQIFLFEKRVEGIDTDVDDLVKVLVATSAVIPTFAFPVFNYPHLNEVLIYPSSFNRQFEGKGENKMDENIEGMVGNRFMARSLLLSKPALLAGFNGRSGEDNVGIHEFVHLLDREDGETDGIPERLMENNYVIPWLRQIKGETARIKQGKSDINPYAITNNAEFLAVVSEYFFNDPEEFEERHPDLYRFLSGFYGQQADNKS